MEAYPEVASQLHIREVESWQREGWVPHKGDLVSALPTTPGVASSNGSSPRRLLDFCGVICGSGLAIWCKQQAWWGEDNLFLALSVMNTFLRELLW